MTESELAVLEALANAEDASRGWVAGTSPQQTLALIAEVKRLRALGKQAAEYLQCYRDEGPEGQGWQSRELMTLCAELEAL